MKNTEQQVIFQKFESLNKRTVGDIIVNSIHFNDRGIGIIFQEGFILSICSAFQIGFILSGRVFRLFFLRHFSSDLHLKIKAVDRNTCIMEDAVFDIVIKSFFGQFDFRMILKNDIRRLSLFKKGLDFKTQFFDFIDSGVNADAGIDKQFLVLFLGYISRI